MIQATSEILDHFTTIHSVTARLLVDLYQHPAIITCLVSIGLFTLKQGARMRGHKFIILKGLTNLVFAAVLAFSMTGIAQANRLTTGNDLMQHCVASPDNFCAGYIGGVFDTSHTLFCNPP